jgi:hypothetical protein
MLENKITQVRFKKTMTTTLFLAFGIYIVGVAVILVLRPHFMFGTRGWKEFGVSKNSQYTIFPFWMFTIVWAFASYALATLGGVVLANMALNSEPVFTGSVATPISSVGPNLSTPLPTLTKTVSSSPPSSVPGYYILDRTKDVPNYIYFGSEPPTIDNLRAYSG